MRAVPCASARRYAPRASATGRPRARAAAAALRPATRPTATTTTSGSTCACCGGSTLTAAGLAMEDVLVCDNRHARLWSTCAALGCLRCPARNPNTARPARRGPWRTRRALPGVDGGRRPEQRTALRRVRRRRRSRHAGLAAVPVAEPLHGLRHLRAAGRAAGGAGGAGGARGRRRRRVLVRRSRRVTASWPSSARRSRRRAGPSSSSPTAT